MRDCLCCSSVAPQRPSLQADQVCGVTAPVFPRLALLLEMALHVVGGTRVQVAGNSMEPALLPGDRLLVSRLASRWPFAPRRGRIVLLRSAPDTRPESIKRVAGLPGERIALVDGRWLVDGCDLGEPSTPFDGMAASSAREDNARTENGCSARATTSFSATIAPAAPIAGSSGRYLPRRSSALHGIATRRLHAAAGSPG
jgi:signal peptidase I